MPAARRSSARRGEADARMIRCTATHLYMRYDPERDDPGAAVHAGGARGDSAEGAADRREGGVRVALRGWSWHRSRNDDLLRRRHAARQRTRTGLFERDRAIAAADSPTSRHPAR